MSFAVYYRRTDENDARKIIITPTEEGLALEEYLKQNAADTEEVLLCGMTDSEKEEFYRLLKIALDNANAVKNSGEWKKDE